MNKKYFTFWYYNINNSVSYSWWITYVINSNSSMNRAFYFYDLLTKTTSKIYEWSWTNWCWDYYALNHQIVLNNNDIPYIHFVYRKNDWSCTYTNYTPQYTLINTTNGSRTAALWWYPNYALRYNWFIKDYYFSSVYGCWIVSHTSSTQLRSIQNSWWFSSIPTCSFTPTNIFSHNWNAYFYRLDTNILRFCKIDDSGNVSNYITTLNTGTYTLLNHDYYKGYIYLKNSTNNIIKYKTTDNTYTTSPDTYNNLYFVFKTTDKWDKVSITWNYVYKKELDLTIKNSINIEWNNTILWKILYWYKKDSITNNDIESIYSNLSQWLNNLWNYIIRKGDYIFTIWK